MTRILCTVGFESTGSHVKGVWTGVITERVYKGEVVEDARSLSPSDQVNDDIRRPSRLKLVVDKYGLDNHSAIKYVLWGGERWRAEDISKTRPTLMLTLGGLYDGPIPT